MAFWINIYGCQPYPRHGSLKVNQLKNHSFCQALYSVNNFVTPKASKYVSYELHFFMELTSVLQIFVSLWFDEVFSTYFVALHLWVTMRFNNLSSLCFMGLMRIFSTYFIALHCELKWAKNKLFPMLWRGFF